MIQAPPRLWPVALLGAGFTALLGGGLSAMVAALSVGGGAGAQAWAALVFGGAAVGLVAAAFASGYALLVAPLAARRGQLSLVVTLALTLIWGFVFTLAAGYTFLVAVVGTEISLLEAVSAAGSVGFPVGVMGCVGVAIAWRLVFGWRGVWRADG